MRIHVLSVGGRIMHNLAIDLVKKGHQVTGSDDEIYNPSKTRLINAGIFPEKLGWNANIITEDIDIVVLGMHAREDNPELLKAQKLGLKIMSYPEFVALEAKNKKKIVVAGSHGKTSTTAMIMHVLKARDIDFDFLVGAELEGFESMIRISNSELMIIEGDEYLSSAIDKKAKMLHYDPDIAVITGIEWDHINVFPNFESYLSEFETFIKNMKSESKLYFFLPDPVLTKLVLDTPSLGERVSYDYIKHDRRGRLLHDDKKHEVSVFGNHNLANMEAARLVCGELGINTETFINSIQDFTGASKRLELIIENEKLKVYRDFAHAPSKVRATTSAVREKFPHKKITAVFELHTYSSLNKAFIPHYKDTFNGADELILFFNEQTLNIKKMPMLNDDFLKNSIGFDGMTICKKPLELSKKIEKSIEAGTDILLLMSSGNYGKMDLTELFSN